MKIYEAMGAKSIDKKDVRKLEKIDMMFISDDYVGQRKLNGERLMLHKADDSEEVRLFGRGFSKSNERMEKTDLLPHIVSLAQFLPSGTALDGEVLFVPKDQRDKVREFDFAEDFWKCREIMGSYASKAVPQQQEEGWLYYVVFDCLRAGGVDITGKPYQARYWKLQEVLETSGIVSEYLLVLPIVEGETNKRTLLEECINLGLEGIILKNRFGLYYEGKKPTNQWVKLKQELEADGVIMGYSAPNRWTKIQRDGKFVLGEDGEPIEEESKYYQRGWIGAIWVGQYVPMKLTGRGQLSKFREMNFGPVLIEPHFAQETRMIDGVEHQLVPVAKISGMDELTREKISANMRMYLGTVVEFNYFEKTDDSYFQPRIKCFRHDKRAEECVW